MFRVPKNVYISTMDNLCFPHFFCCLPTTWSSRLEIFPWVFLGSRSPFLGMAKVFQKFHKGGYWVSIPGTSCSLQFCFTVTAMWIFFYQGDFSTLGGGLFKEGDDGNWNDQPMVNYVNWWFGARWFGFRLDPQKWKRVGSYVKLPGGVAIFWVQTDLIMLTVFQPSNWGQSRNHRGFQKKISIHFKSSMPLWPKKSLKENPPKRLNWKWSWFNTRKHPWTLQVVPTFPKKKRSFSRTELEVEEWFLLLLKIPCEKYIKSST